MKLHTLLAFCMFCIAANAAEPVRIYLANDDHMDFMWTADADTYADVFVEMLDFHLKLADETATNAPPYRNRFNADGNYWLWNCEQKKTPAEFARLIGRLKDGTLSVPLNALVSCYGGQPAEAVLRGMYCGGRLERQHGVRLRLAVAMENQTLPLGLASLFAGSGTKGMTVSNPDLAFARLGHSTATHLDTTTPQIHLLAGGQVDGPNLGIRGQNGNTRFLQRFALRPHGGYHPAAAMKFALEHQNPFVTGAIIASGAYPETTHSLLKVSNPDVLLWALKPHEDGIERGLVARLWNLSDQPAEPDITFAGGISVAHRMTHIETDVEAVPLTAAGTLPATFTRQQIQTYRFNPQ